MLSLAALVADDALELTVLVPGPPGAVDAEVLWLHNTELPDPSPYIRETELVLTNGLWRATVGTALFTPFFYLAGMGLGLGSLINQNPASTARCAGRAGLPGSPKHPHGAPARSAVATHTA